jgi:thymidylate kinase
MSIVAIVGPDGSGKTTHAKLLVDSLGRMGYDATYLRPVFLPFTLLKDSQGTGEREISLPSARRLRHSQYDEAEGGGNVSRLSSFLGQCVMGYAGFLYALIAFVVLSISARTSQVAVCDRYFFQYFFDLYGKRADTVIDVFPRPHITYLIEGDLDLLVPRMRDPSDVSASRAYHIAVLQLYSTISDKYDFVQLDAHSDVNELSEQILAHLVERIGEPNDG